ncbi:MAG: adenine phosphoribosyltransferase [bacterium]|nr:adenine phosphoribosyltransferase [bacterium]
MAELSEKLRRTIRDVPDFPKPGIIFKDITPVLKSPELFRKVIQAFCDRYREKGVTAIVAIESRGFIFGGALAERMGVPFVPVRKKSKLPYKTVSATYELEYGTDSVEMHADALGQGDRVVVLDDLVATGGTAQATARLCEQLGAEVVELAFVIELAFLHPRKKLSKYPVFSLVTFD